MVCIQGAIGLNDQVFSDVVGNLLLRDVNCNGSESLLLNCQHNRLLETFCTPHEDAGVVCQGNAPIVTTALQ